MTHRFLFLVVALTSLVGCGSDGPKLHDVSGKITLDGHPLADAEVEFQPAAGSPSFGKTNASGDYTLAFAPDRPGAIAGEHAVRITTYRRNPEPGSTEIIPERVPAKYNSESTLKASVPEGSYNFDLSSQ